MNETNNSPENIRNVNRASIFNGIKKICKEIERHKGEFEIKEQIELINESGKSIELQMLVKMALEYSEPFVTISLTDNEGSSVASRILAISLDKKSKKPKIIVTDRVDTFMHEGIGIGSGLLQSSELVVKKVVELHPFPRNATVVLRLHDGTNNSLHKKRGWSGAWATRLGYTPVEGQENYFEKVLV